MVGETDVMADAELLSIAIEIMRGFGLTSSDVQARVSDRRLLNALLTHLMIPESAWTAVYAVLDKLERQPREVSAEKLTAAGLSPAVCDTVLGFGTLDFTSLQTQYGSSPVVAPHIAEFATYLTHLEAMGVGAWLRFDLTIVRGLAYYTGIVFELFDAVGEFRAICGGGRYDALLASLGGADLPALGFGLGDVVLGELLRARGKMPDVRPTLDVWVAQAPDTAAYPAAMIRVSAALRHADVIVEHALRAQRLDKQIEAARKAGASCVVIVQTDASGVETYRVRQIDHDDHTFDRVETLLEWASTLHRTKR